jgi:hypothetical protein
MKVREGAEKVAGTNMAQRRANEPRSVNGVLEGWLVAAHAIRFAKTDEDALVEFAKLRGKPIAPRSPEVTS